MSKNTLKSTEQQIAVAREMLEGEQPHTISAVARHSGISRPTILSYQQRGILPWSKRQLAERGLARPPEPDRPVVITSDIPASPQLLENRESEIAKLRTELESIAYANMLDFADWDADKVTLRSSADLSRAMGASIKSVSQTKDGIKIQMHDKLAAISKLLQLFGVKTIEDPPPGQTGVTNNFLIQLSRVVEQSGRIDIEDAQLVD